MGLVDRNHLKKFFNKQDSGVSHNPGANVEPYTASGAKSNMREGIRETRIKNVSPFQSHSSTDNYGITGLKDNSEKRLEFTGERISKGFTESIGNFNNTPNLNTNPNKLYYDPTSIDKTMHRNAVGLNYPLGQQSVPLRKENPWGVTGSKDMGNISSQEYFLVANCAQQGTLPNKDREREKNKLEHYFNKVKKHDHTKSSTTLHSKGHTDQSGNVFKQPPDDILQTPSQQKYSGYNKAKPQ
jgi:hypothetical protein